MILKQSKDNHEFMSPKCFMRPKMSPKCFMRPKMSPKCFMRPKMSPKCFTVATPALFAALPSRPTAL